MGFQSLRSGYTVRVDGLLLGKTRFVIQGAVEYDERLSEGELAALVPRAQMELLLAIEGEEERARRLGAETIRVGVVGDEALYRFYRMRATPRTIALGLAAAPARARPVVPVGIRSRSLASRDRGVPVPSPAPRS